ncbi:hypothetical protein [Streptomyces montanisoli]|uniref:Uncharacterized protein n=1 Tax=Streptomyces montanisoli TaxID=2798581 RepID=A0A940MK73_9ACTN|nr:hypothetical protein [Streptomyces montanisoli]MBP0461696.1 hypothetical protein [Streptomyces montanisoli]
MSSHTITPPHGATATGAGAVPRQSYTVGDAMRALQVFVSTAFNVAVLGEYADDAGVQRRQVPTPRGPRAPRAPRASRAPRERDGGAG